MTAPPAIAAFGPEHVPGALALSQAEGWPHRAEDWALILGLSRGVVALEDGQVAGTALATSFGPVGMANMIIVGKALRGRGLGRALVEAAMARAQTPAGPTARQQEWRLVATDEGLPLYRRLGYAERGRVVQHQGRLAPQPGLDGGAVAWAGAGDLDAIAVIDRAATGADRRPLIAALAGAGRLAVLRGPGGVAGYGAIRPFGRGEVAGPVVARGAPDAQAILFFLLADRGGRFVRVDTTEVSGLAPWLTGLGLVPVGGGIAMSRGPAAPRSAGFDSFALAAQALG